MSERRHLYEVDLMRGFVMLFVLSVHTLSAFIGILSSSKSAFMIMSGILTSLHFTRETFMFITGLVLFVTYYHSEFNPLRFWLKRLTLVAVPYVAWNVVYILSEGTYEPSFTWSFSAILHELGNSLMFGNQFFLYYVLVSIQLYVVFPLLLFGLRKTERWHVHIFILSFLAELIFMYLSKSVLPHIRAASLPLILRDMDVHRAEFVLTYQFWFIAGGIFSAHYSEIRDYIVRHARALWIAFGVILLLLYGHYILDSLVLGESYGQATTVLQPIMIPYSLMVTVIALLLGCGWASRRLRMRWRHFSRFVKLASETSFGIFLVQPFPLMLMENTVRRITAPDWVLFCLIPFSVLFVYFSSMLIAFFLARVPILSYVVGRRTHWHRQLAS